MFKECRNFLKDRKDIAVSFVRKQANKIAHIVARKPCEVNCFVHFMTPPNSVLESLENESFLH